MNLKSDIAISPTMEKLIRSLATIPGIGPKSATRMAYEFVLRKKEAAQNLATNLDLALKNLSLCQSCRHITEYDLCQICQSHRQTPQICVVETPTDLLTIEQTGHYNGTYFVLHGSLSPIDGRGPQELGLNLLHQKLKMETYKEVILATNATMEGEATADYIQHSMQVSGILYTRLATGVPMGGEVAYIDHQTLIKAFDARTTSSSEDLT
jgi:recombination protein RecR